MATLPKVMFWLALALWIGGHVFFSFLMGPRVFAAFSRPEAGRIVAAIFPVYFAVGYVCGAIVLAVSVWQHRQAWLGGWVAPVLAGAALALTLTGGLWLQPKLHDLRTQIYAGAEPLPAGHPVRKDFGKWHGVSLLINGLVMVAGIALIVRTASR